MCYGYKYGSFGMIATLIGALCILAALIWDTLSAVDVEKDCDNKDPHWKCGFEAFDCNCYVDILGFETVVCDERAYYRNQDGDDAKDIERAGSVYFSLNLIGLVCMIVALSTSWSYVAGFRRFARFVMFLGGLACICGAIVWQADGCEAKGKENDDDTSWETGGSIYLSFIGGGLTVIAGVLEFF